MASTQTEHLRWTSTDLIACEPLRTLKTLTPSESFERSSARATTSPSYDTDSGYATLANTPNDPAKVNQPAFIVTASFPKRLFKKKIVLREYENLEISDAEWARFRDSQRLIFGRPLFEYIAEKHPKLLRHNKGQFFECSFRLAMLGENEASATSRILVQCDKIVAKTVRQYFCQPNIREQYEFPEEHNHFPSLKLHVFDRAPVRKAATEPIHIGLSYNYLYEPDRVFVKVENDIGARRYATIGGAIEITTDDGSVKRWNLTVGHVFDEVLPDNSYLALSHPPDEPVTEHEPAPSFGENEHCCSDDNGQICDEGMDSETQFVLEEHYTTARLRSGDCSPRVEWFSDLSFSGFHRCTKALVVTAGHGVPLSHRSHGWAIIDAPHVSPCPFGLPSRELGLPSGGPHAASQHTRQVVFHRGTGAAQTGILSQRPAFIMSGVDGSVVENYTLRLRDRSATRPGDCGSWVVDREDAVVYGYVVASDALGDAYVMPMDAVLENIESALGAQDVKLYQLPELSPLPDMQAHTATQYLADITGMQRGSPCGSPCGSLDGVIYYPQETILDSGYVTAMTTPQGPVRQAAPYTCEPRHSSVIPNKTPYQDNAASHSYKVLDRPSIRSSPRYLPDNGLPSNLTSPFEEPWSLSEMIVERRQQQRAVTRPFNIPKDEGQQWSSQPLRWQTTKYAVSWLKNIFRSGNSESKSEGKIHNKW